MFFADCGSKKLFLDRTKPCCHEEECVLCWSEYLGSLTRLNIESWIVTRFLLENLNDVFSFGRLVQDWIKSADICDKAGCVLSYENLVRKVEGASNLVDLIDGDGEPTVTIGLPHDFEYVQETDKDPLAILVAREEPAA